MSRGVNKVTLIGNLGNDPELKYTQSGMAVANVSLATSSQRKDKDGNVVEKTEWHRVKYFGKLAEIVGEYLRKGSQIYVEGSIQYGKYTDKDGIERYTTDIMGDEMTMLGGTGEGERRPQSRGNDRPAASRPAARPARREPPTARETYREPQRDFSDDFTDDDIPF